ncbi:hypothetical protein N7532_003127 [Penicillium argentinense]|uniref:4-hydroxyphenylpyruvate dioxygenase n=1 Tax=Penicillium argentinense TaxID=1131581 RepID=A0A9W9KEB8_9EURO|nr:uncharacterized protein N7532_003127 [Penicillium argentinense]KAJ5102598.1 hypothetical protein N7532_003127 [Penicillium argentinense]
MTVPEPDEAIFPSNLGPEYVGFDHIQWYVGNAKQAASYYITRFDFALIAYRGPETGSLYLASYAIANGRAVFILTSPVCGPSHPENKALQNATAEDRATLSAIHEQLTIHGDGVADVAFEVKGNIGAVWKRAIENGASAISKPRTVASEGGGSITTATIGTYGDTVHSLINRENYPESAPFLPGFQTVQASEGDPINLLLPSVRFLEIDHCVGNQPWGGVDKVVQYYEKCLEFHRYWTVDDKAMCSDYSAMRSIVVASPNETIKMPMNEPAAGKKKSQIEEFVDYYHGSGVQHIAFRTEDIVEAVTHLQKRGVQFLRVPEGYYTDLRQRLSKVSWTLDADVDVLKQLNILVDFDERGYLLQIFAKHVGDRPTVFVEVIQRQGFDGFGAGNFKSLFEAFEREQALRGNW